MVVVVVPSFERIFALGTRLSLRVEILLWPQRTKICTARALTQWFSAWSLVRPKDVQVAMSKMWPGGVLLEALLLVSLCQEDPFRTLHRYLYQTEFTLALTHTSP